MRMTVLAAGAMMLASCTTAEMHARRTRARGQQRRRHIRGRRRCLRRCARRGSKSAVGWPDLGYRPHGY